MLEGLFDLLDSLTERENDIRTVLKVLGGDDDNDFLLDETGKVELLIVKALGGNEGHYKHVGSTDLFYNYVSRKTDEDKNELIDYIKLTIDNGWTDEVTMTLVRG